MSPGRAALLTAAVAIGALPATGATSPLSGRDMFVTYCASCHGTDAKGGGPVAAALKARPADLTTLSARNGGRFPETRVYGTIRGDVRVTSHGTSEMPVWGRVFEHVGQGDTAEVQMRISNLVAWIRSIQVK
ncbi:MAG TPA: c-type cytochrome [Bryobacteraceae bacterium]|nr:c-type cytochrome [Bryobacteraceae bacterium]